MDDLFELTEELHQEIVNDAVTLASSIIEDPEYMQIKQFINQSQE